MTPEQEEKDLWRFRYLLISGWVTIILYLSAMYWYVNACRHSDMRTFRDMVDIMKCPCANKQDITNQIELLWKNANKQDK